tara:strand:+ start:38981 stop:39841 length:861 start_codon:yes stop_codon:yes gene_type:complete
MNIELTGTLYIVATPIGNLGDISIRAIQVLKDVAIIACESSRHSKLLLNRYCIHSRTISYQEQNDQKGLKKILYHLSCGESVAFISDAGTPLISDPGYRLVSSARDAGHNVIPVPGCCALIAAISVSGLPSNQFRFVGFLSAKVSQRRSSMKSLCDCSETLIFYEAPHRIQATLEDAVQHFGSDRIAFMAREISKKFETYHRALLGQLYEFVKSDPNQQRGEIVLVVSGKQEKTEVSEVESERILDLLLGEMSPSKAAALTSKITGVQKNTLYKKALSAQTKIKAN